MSWQEEAACNPPPGGMSDLFFSEEPADIELSMSICRRCPVRDECLLQALERPEEHGIWGGMTAEQRGVTRNLIWDYSQEGED